MVVVDDWHNCYGDGWKGIVFPATFKHPAKVSRALIRRIYQHLREEGWVESGDTVLDPFAGVGLGGLDAARAGMNFVGVELEPAFVEIANRNIELWNYFASGFSKWGNIAVFQGDSRYFLQTLSGVGICVSSPPYAATRITGKGDEGTSGLRNPDGSFVRGKEGWEARKALGERYGHSQGNLGNLPDGDGVDDFWSAAKAIVSQVYRLLPSGGHAVWITKRYSRNKKIVEFTDRWRGLCESVGFETLHQHKAMLVERGEVVDNIFGEPIRKIKKHYGFWRREHARKYPELEIEWEDVICQKKPLASHQFL